MLFRPRFSIDMQAFDEYYKKIPMFRIAKIMKCLANSTKLDGIEPDKLDNHDQIFEPKDENEKKLWVACREINKKELIVLQQKVAGGEKGGRPKKIEQLVNVPKLEPKPTPQPVATEENKAKVHNMLEMVAGSYKATDAVVGIFDRPDGTTKEGIRIKNPRLMAFVRQRFDKKVLDKSSDWAIDHNQRGHTYNASSLLKLFCRFQSDVEPTINFNHVQSEYLTFEYKEPQ